MPLRWHFLGVREFKRASSMSWGKGRASFGTAPGSVNIHLRWLKAPRNKKVKKMLVFTIPAVVKRPSQGQITCTHPIYAPPEIKNCVMDAEKFREEVGNL